MAAASACLTIGAKLTADGVARVLIIAGLALFMGALWLMGDWSEPKR